MRTSNAEGENEGDFLRIEQAVDQRVPSRTKVRGMSPKIPASVSTGAPHDADMTWVVDMMLDDLQGSSGEDGSGSGGCR